MSAAQPGRRLSGFCVPPPAFPALAPAPGEPPRALGAGNTHVELRCNFVELITVVDGASPTVGEATLVPLEAPAEALPRLTDGIAATAARLSAALERFEGLHVLALQNAARDLLVRGGFLVRETAGGTPFVPASAALGAAVLFPRAG